MEGHRQADAHRPPPAGAAVVAGAFDVGVRVPLRRLRRRSGLLLRGPAGWGEHSPFDDYPPERAGRWLRAALEAAVDGWPPPRRDRVAVNVTVPAVEPQRAAELTAASGCATAKVKVAEPGDDPGAEDDRVAAVRDALPAGGRLRLDANGGWEPDEAVRRLRRLARHDLEYCEQPCAGLDGLAEVRRRVDVPVAADESVRLAPDPRRVPGLRESADVVVLKAHPLGGVRAALEVAEAFGGPCAVSSALETSVGLAAGLALAAALPDLPHASGLGTATMLADDPAADPLVPDGGVLTVRAAPPSAERLERLAPEPSRREDLLASLARAAQAAGVATPPRAG